MLVDPLIRLCDNYNHICNYLGSQSSAENRSGLGWCLDLQESKKFHWLQKYIFCKLTNDLSTQSEIALTAQWWRSTTEQTPACTSGWTTPSEHNTHTHQAHVQTGKTHTVRYSVSYYRCCSETLTSCTHQLLSSCV